MSLNVSGPVTTVESSLQDRIGARVAAAVAVTVGATDSEPPVRPSTRPGFGDYQCNAALRWAKTVRLPPLELAERIVENLDIDDLCEVPEIAGPGFVNLTVRANVLARDLTRLLDGDVVTPARTRRRVVVDYSSPNVAKQMHVGHLRSTVIGDALSRVLSAVGHEVIRQNHVGDWGTQFGMLIEQLGDEYHDMGQLDLEALDALYRRARVRFDGDLDFADRARRRVVALQSGDPETVGIWTALVKTSSDAFDAMYRRLGVQLTAEDIAGESTYNDDLVPVLDALRQRDLVTVSDGASCVFVDGFVNRDGQPLPMIVRKADGGFGYDATDLAALRHRIDHLRADRLVYVVDVRQSLHFEHVFAVARAAGWLPDRVEADHVAFGTILGEDGRPFKTRSGEVVALASLLDAAERKAHDLLVDRGSELDSEALAATARAVAVGALKYADLSNDLARDYVFALDRMVAMDGETGPYLQYAHARLSSLIRRGGEPSTSVVVVLDEPVERRLALLLLNFDETVAEVATTLQPHRLCSHLYQIATTLSSFYEACPVLRAESALRDSRLALCRATRRVLATGLDLLGIEPLQRM